MAAPTRFNDRRYSKYGKLNMRQEPRMDELQRRAESVAVSRFQLDDWVKTPIGWKRVSDMYYFHSEATWVYRFHEADSIRSFKDAQLSPLPDTWFTPESEVLLPTGNLAKVLGYAGNLVIVELRPKQFVGICEDELRKLNPIQDHALRLLYRAVCGEYLLEVDAKRAFKLAMPNYPIVGQERV